jgi:hypothetical protein
VFPIGMYGVATYRMIAVTGLNDLDLLPQLALAMALIAWSAAFAGLVARLGKRGFARLSPTTQSTGIR